MAIEADRPGYHYLYGTEEMLMQRDYRGGSRQIRQIVRNYRSYGPLDVLRWSLLRQAHSGLVSGIPRHVVTFRVIVMEIL